MDTAPSLIVRLYGTEECVSAPRVLRAGPLSAELEAGNLRYVRFGSIELIRAISFIVRDRNWGTYSTQIDKLSVHESDAGFKVSYDAVARDAEQEFRYRATIEATRKGLVFRVEGEAVTNFLTNRTGFVVLHPIAGVAGGLVEIERVDGQVVQGRFPELIDPVQPMMDLRCLSHEAAPGLRVSCRMEGDTFEMEDQRNWTDASYKTYVRPLALPWPYTVPAGTHLEQSVLLAAFGSATAANLADGVVTLTLGADQGPAPALGLGLDPEQIEPTRYASSTLALVRPQHVICHYDPRRGHDRETLRSAAATASGLGARPWLEAVLTSIDGVEREIASLGEAVSAIGAPFDVVLLSPAPDLKCTLPGSTWPPAPPAEAVFRAARQAFPGARIGGGMFSLFTEMNRKRPPIALLDLVSFTTTALVHAGDDRSVMETLESLPAISGSARAIAGALPFAVGPSAIGLRMNPYGEAPMANPRNIRQAMNFNDPRQHGLLGAAWAIGYYARFARGGARAITFGGTTGPFGLLHTPQSWPVPWYEEHGGLFPVFHALRGLAGLAGHTQVALDSSDPRAVLGICCYTGQEREMWIANLTPDTLRVVLPAPARAVFVLDAGRFVDAASTPDLFDQLAPLADPSALTLGAFAVSRVRLP